MALEPTIQLPASELGYYVKDRFDPEKRFYIHDYLCIEHNGEIKKIRIDRFAVMTYGYYSGGKFFESDYKTRFRDNRLYGLEYGTPYLKKGFCYDVPVDLLNEFLPKDAYLRQLRICACANKYLVYKKDEFCSIKIPLIRIDGPTVHNYLNPEIYYMDTMVSREGKTIERPTPENWGSKYFFVEPKTSMVVDEEWLQRCKDKQCLPDMLVYEGEDKEYVDKYIKPDDVSFHKEILQKAFNIFMREMDSGIHLKIGDCEYMIPSTDKHFTWYANRLML